MDKKTIVITGGSSGIGLDIAKAYSRQGADIVLLARNQARLDIAVSACREVSLNENQQILAYSVDVSDQRQLDHCVEDVRRRVKAPDVLILSAGIVVSERFMEQSDASFESVLNINVMGSRAVAKAFLSEMVKMGRGNICFISSLGGLIPTYGYSAYCASKSGVVGMAGALRQELLGTGIGVCVVCPPEVDTPMVAAEAENILPQTRLIKDMGGLLTADAVTKAVLKGIKKNRFIIVPGKMAKFSYWQSRWFPGLFSGFMNQMIKVANRRESKHQ